jgi:hypothetical protein
MQGKNKERKSGVVGQTCQKEGERKRGKKKEKRGGGIGKARQNVFLKRTRFLPTTSFNANSLTLKG